MKINRTASAKWQGGLKDGKGAISTQSGALACVSVWLREPLRRQAGTNPEELIAAAHAGCFTMALSLMLGEAGFTADEMNTTAQVTLEQDGGGFTITHIALTLRAKIPNIDDAKFQEITAKAKAGCPVSKLFKAEITLDAKLA